MTDKLTRLRGDIGLADLARVLVELDLDKPEYLHLAAYSLGFEGLAYPENRKPPAAAEKKMRKPARKTKQKALKQRYSIPPVPQITEKPAGNIIHSTLRPLAELTTQSAPDWVKPVKPEIGKKAKVIRQRLLPRNRSAGVLKAALAVCRTGRRLDVPRLINHVINAKPLLELPRLPVGSLEQGVDLFCDYSESMQPFYTDMDNLKNSLFKILGKDRCRVYEYDVDPNKAIHWSAQDEPLAWTPLAGRPVLIASDFGRGHPYNIRRRLQAGTWRAFLAHIRHQQIPVIACSPLPPATLPNWLGSETKIIHWDPRTRAGAVSRLVGIGHMVRP